MSKTGTLTYVTFAIGERRYALDSAEIAELSRSGQVQAFPHATPGLIGVLEHRNGILPVWDIAQALTDPGEAPRKYFIVARCKFGGIQEWIAIPVSGDCQMLQAEMMPCPDYSPPYIRGLVSLDGESVEVLDLEALATLCMPSGEAEAAAEIEVEAP